MIRWVITLNIISSPFGVAICYLLLLRYHYYFLNATDNGTIRASKICKGIKKGNTNPLSKTYLEKKVDERFKTCELCCD